MLPSRMIKVLERVLVLAVACGCAVALAKEPKAASKKTRAPMFEMPSFQALPQAEGLKQRDADTTVERPALREAAAPVYTIVSVAHLSAVGAPMSALPLSGQPRTTPRFQSSLKVRCPQKVSAPIEVVVLDAKQDTVMTATGRLTYRPSAPEVTEYTIDWSPSPVTRAGDLQVLVRVAGQALGTWPLPVEPEKK